MAGLNFLRVLKRKPGVVNKELEVLPSSVEGPVEVGNLATSEIAVPSTW